MPATRLFLAGLILVICAPFLHANSSERWVEAEGLAFINSQADSDAARRRALGEAMVFASYAGGADVQGRTAIRNARVTSDLAIIRPSGRVLRHELVSAQVDQGHWRVRIRALVGPKRTAVCTGRRSLIFDATPPDIAVSPQAGAWSEAVANGLATDIIDTIAALPSVRIESIAIPTNRRLGAALDYTTLTRGERVTPAGNHRLETSIKVDEEGARTRLTLTLTVIEPTGRGIRQSFSRAARVADNGVAAFWTNGRRSRGEGLLVDGLGAEISAFFRDLTCLAPEAELAFANGTLSVPIGRRHGLTRGSMAFVDDPRNSFDLLEIVSLSDRQAVLRPLDPTKSPGAFAGRKITFLETGL